MSVRATTKASASHRPIPMHSEFPKPANKESKTQKRKANKANHQRGGGK